MRKRFRTYLEVFQQAWKSSHSERDRKSQVCPSFGLEEPTIEIGGTLDDTMTGQNPWFDKSEQTILAPDSSFDYMLNKIIGVKCFCFPSRSITHKN